MKISKNLISKNNIPLELLIELYININENHLNMFFKNNYKSIPLDICNFKHILFVDYYIKNYENKNEEKYETIIRNIEDLYKYSLISFYINNERKTIHNIYTIYDFSKMLEDMNAIIYLECILDINNLNIKKYYPKYVKSPLQIYL